ncbi:unnamed protein product [Fraxinus pennsylvanica]|uniref:Uncharacterized protein n=1 Tax=Fraxinus pennsylvanica TaxID=56036 RepID=A0AAD2AHY3_9LAMI|nr:unnamed protein product [Fraxinus pennsylvanica]
MVMGTERSKALHNFTMPCGLRWGNQRYLRCMKVNSNGQISTLSRFHGNDSDSSDYKHQQRRTTRENQRDSDGSHKMGPTRAVNSFGGGRRFGDGDDDGIAAVREKVMSDLMAVADKMKDQIFKEGLQEDEIFVSPSRPPPPPPPSPAAGGIYMSWNLRTRRAACKAPSSGSVAGGSGRNGGAVDGATAGGNNIAKAMTVDVMKPSSVLLPIRTPSTCGNKSPRLRIGILGAAESPSGEKREIAKFSVPLLRREIEEDFMAMVGHKPPRRPKKRAKNVQKELDTLFPGLCCSIDEKVLWSLKGLRIC